MLSLSGQQSHFKKDVNDIEATHTKIDNKVIIVSLKSQPMGKLINRIPGSSL